MYARRRYSKSEADLLAMRLRYENSVSLHKQAADSSKLRAAIEAADKIRNLQNQYGILVEANQRLPLALQGPAMQRLKDVGDALIGMREKYPFNYPRGADPSNAVTQAERRRLN